MATDPVTKFLSRFNWRDLAHALVAYLTTFAGTLGTSLAVDKSLLVAAAPAIGAVIFRQLFPHVTASATEINTAVANAERTLNRAVALSPVLAPAASTIGMIESTVAKAEPVVDEVVAPTPRVN
jgi:hypothetical protein